MNKDEFSTHMFTAVSTTLENMAFAETLISESDFIPDENGQSVSLEILEPTQGAMTMSVSSEFLAHIAEALFSIPVEEIEEEKMKDLLSELLNTIAGSFMTQALHEDTSFKLGIPEHNTDCQTSSLSEIKWNYTAEGNSFAIIASGELIDFLENL